MTLLIAFFAQRTVKMVGRNDPALAMTSRSDEGSVVRLGAQGFMFAVSEVDPTVGTLSAKFIIRKSSKNSDVSSREEREIDLVPCEELLPGGNHAGESNNVQFDVKSLVEQNPTQKYRCPLDILDVSLTGNYHADAFHYIKIAMTGC